MEISVDTVAKCGANSASSRTFSLLTCLGVDNLFMVIFQLIRMSSYAKNKLQLCSVTQHQCRRRQMSAKFSLIL